MSMETIKIVLDAAGIDRALRRIAKEILDDGHATDGLVLVGLRTGGVFLAQRLKGLLEKDLGRPVPVGTLDINMYRDDWTRASTKPVVRKTEISFSIDDKRVVLVDDVLFTGRTIRSAMNALMDFGRPGRIELVILVDRGHRELPVCPDYTGIVVKTSLEEHVNVYFADLGARDEVTVEGPSPQTLDKTEGFG
jgi:pyrimidine operon attenuation protein / uracil phosphoribosyltransferase